MIRALVILLLTAGLNVYAQQTPADKEQVIRQFKKDLELINKTYAQLKRAEFAYTYSFYPDASRAKLIQSFAAGMVMNETRSYYNYQDTEILYDSAFTLIINHEEKRIDLLKKQEKKQAMNPGSLLDSAALHAVLKQVESIRVDKKNKITRYEIVFNAGAQLSAMSVSFDQAAIIREIAVSTPSQERETNAESAALEPGTLVITCNRFSADVKNKTVLNLGTYFKLFGNGQYVLSDLYQTYTLNNLYEKQDL